jgi:hypothetical protein
MGIPKSTGGGTHKRLEVSPLELTRCVQHRSGNVVVPYPVVRRADGVAGVVVDRLRQRR